MSLGGTAEITRSISDSSRIPPIPISAAISPRQKEAVDVRTLTMSTVTEPVDERKFQKRLYHEVSTVKAKPSAALKSPEYSGDSRLSVTISATRHIKRRGHLSLNRYGSANHLRSPAFRLAPGPLEEFYIFRVPSLLRSQNQFRSYRRQGHREQVP